MPRRRTEPVSSGRKLNQLGGRGCPCPVAGRSLRASLPSAHSMPAACAIGIQACACRQRRLRGMGNPDPTTVKNRRIWSRSAFHLRHAAGESPRRVPSGPPRLDANPRRRGHHRTRAARNRPPGRRPAAGGPQSSPGPGMARRALKPQARRALYQDRRSSTSSGVRAAITLSSALTIDSANSRFLS